MDCQKGARIGFDHGGLDGCHHCGHGLDLDGHHRRTLTDPLVAVVRQLNAITPGQAASLSVPAHLKRNEVGVLVAGMK